MLPTQVLLQKKKGKYKDSYQCQERKEYLQRSIQFLLFQPDTYHSQMPWARGTLQQRILCNMTTYISAGRTGPKGSGNDSQDGWLGEEVCRRKSPIVVDWWEHHHISWLNVQTLKLPVIVLGVPKGGVREMCWTERGPEFKSWSCYLSRKVTEAPLLTFSLSITWRIGPGGLWDPSSVKASDHDFTFLMGPQNCSSPLKKGKKMF